MVGISKRRIGQLVCCTQCGKEKSWEVGGHAFKSEKGKPRQPCSQCDSTNREARKKLHPERERVNATLRMQHWRKNNPEKERDAWLKPRKFNKELARERINRWRRQHPETRVIEFQNRKAVKLQLPHSFTRYDWRVCLAYWNNRCCICGRKAGNGYAIAQEHWVPLADTREDNPGTVPWNILPMCHARNGAKAGCNNLKGTKEPIAWLESFLGQSTAQQKGEKIESYFMFVKRNAKQANNNAVTPPVMKLLMERSNDALC